ncbi:hypothetical protein GUJ93_ZPchr0010g8450 [Zizania palustris]|uniref:Uncharacterized protein n=1 Tax=Zizania palustris TaxID=103762 RepID=A0A8J5TIH5_ZIZPA|nr:hypothetical protein GUJ93_ZPchr0010g8450 [Zizania palustris]
MFLEAVLPKARRFGVDSSVVVGESPSTASARQGESSALQLARKVGLASDLSAGRWLWFPKSSPLVSSNLHLGFPTRWAEVRRFGDSARKVVRTAPRLVDSRSFAEVVEDFDSISSLPFKPDNSKIKRGGNQEGDVSDPNLIKKKVTKDKEESSQGGNENEKLSKESNVEHIEGTEEFGSDHDKGGQVDSLEYEDELSDEDNGGKSEDEDKLMDLWITESGEENRDTVLAKIALDSGIQLGRNNEEAISAIDTLKAKELAQALICAAKNKINSVQKGDCTVIEERVIIRQEGDSLESIMENGELNQGVDNTVSAI